MSQTTLADIQFGEDFGYVSPVGTAYTARKLRQTMRNGEDVVIACARPDHNLVWLSTDRAVYRTPGQNDTGVRLGDVAEVGLLFAWSGRKFQVLEVFPHFVVTCGQGCRTNTNFTHGAKVSVIGTPRPATTYSDGRRSIGSLVSRMLFMHREEPFVVTRAEGESVHGVNIRTGLPKVFGKDQDVQTLELSDRNLWGVADVGDVGRKVFRIGEHWMRCPPTTRASGMRTYVVAGRGERLGRVYKFQYLRCVGDNEFVVTDQPPTHVNEFVRVSEFCETAKVYKLDAK